MKYDPVTLIIYFHLQLYNNNKRREKNYNTSLTNYFSKFIYNEFPRTFLSAHVNKENV